MAASDLLIALVGFVAGLAGGALGIGGGIVLVPALTLAFGVPQATAQGTSLATIVPTSVSGAIAQDRAGNVMRRAAGWMAAVGVVGAVVGALLALSLPTEVLARVFGAFLLLSSWRLWRAGDAAASSPRGDG
jgi:uncharacterized membrane protein YfcA